MTFYVLHLICWSSSLITLPGGKDYLFLTSCLNIDRVGKFQTSCLPLSVVYQMPVNLLQSSLMMFFSHSGQVSPNLFFSIFATYASLIVFTYMVLWRYSCLSVLGCQSTTHFSGSKIIVVALDKLRLLLCFLLVQLAIFCS